MTKFDPLLLQSAPFQNWAIVSFWFLNFSLRSHIQCIIKFCIKNLTTSHHPHGLHPNPAVPWCLAQVTLIVSFFFPWTFTPVFKRATEVPLYKHKSEHLSSSRAYQSRAKFLQGLLHHTTPLLSDLMEYYSPVVVLPPDSVSLQFFELTRCPPTSGPWHMLQSASKLLTPDTYMTDSIIVFKPLFKGHLIGRSSLYSLSVFSYFIFIHNI